MALSRNLGTIFLSVGVIVLLGGIGAAVFAFVDQGQDDGGFFGDDGREARNEQLQIGGTIAAVAGLILVVVGVIPVIAARAT